MGSLQGKGPPMDINSGISELILLHVYRDPDKAQYVCIAPDGKVHGANMGPIWGRQDPGGPHVGPMNFVIWDLSLCVARSSSVVVETTWDHRIIFSHEKRLWKVKSFRCGRMIENNRIIMSSKIRLYYILYMPLCLNIIPIYQHLTGAPFCSVFSP